MPNHHNPDPERVNTGSLGGLTSWANADARGERHDLRHTAASLSASAGASIKVLQNQLGHADARMTLNVYSGLYEQDLVTVADNLGAMWTRETAGDRVVI
jgi:integrase